MSESPNIPSTAGEQPLDVYALLALADDPTVSTAEYLVTITSAVPVLARRLREAEAKRDRLRAAIVEHHSQKADDRCIEDDDRLYTAAGLPPCDRRVGSKEEMLANCARFIDKRCEEGGWRTYREIEEENAKLRDFCRRLVACYDGEGDVYELAEEVRAALSQTEPPGT